MPKEEKEEEFKIDDFPILPPDKEEDEEDDQVF